MNAFWFPLRTTGIFPVCWDDNYESQYKPMAKCFSVFYVFKYERQYYTMYACAVMKSESEALINNFNFQVSLRYICMIAVMVTEPGGVGRL